jgi:predicted transcriptional regulator
MERGADLPRKENAAVPPQGKNYLLAIGIDRYQHWPKLQNAVRDAQDVISVLTAQYQFEEAEVVELFDEKATEGNIYNAIRDLKRNITPQDNLMVYYSGHGHYDDDFDEGHWIPVDAGVGSEDRYISNSNIIKRINAIDAHHILLIVDSCFSGSLVVANRSFIVDEHYRSRRIFSSGRLEAVSDGTPGENSPFASLLLARLKRNTDRAVSTTDLVQYVKKTMVGKSRQAPVDGRVQNSKDEGGEFIFHLKASEEDLWGNVKSEGTVAAYENYLSYYPNGLYANKARQELLVLKEEEVWRSALAKDNETAYRDYMQKYAGSGKYLTEAKQRLEAIQEKFKNRRKILEDLAQKDVERAEIQQKFQSLINLAEQQFTGKELEQARENYRESLQYYMQGFAPSYDYIEQQINFCSNGITFLQHFQNGKEAMDRGNYRLAIQYLTEASKISDDPKVEDLIKVCQQRLSRPKSTPRKEPARATEPMQSQARGQAMGAGIATAAPRKKKRYRGLIIGLSVVVFLLILVAVGNNLDQPASSSSIYPAAEEVYQESNNNYNEPAGKAAPGTQERIIGAWSVTDLTTNGVSIKQMGVEYQQMLDMINYTFSFQNNNQVLITTAVNSEYQTYYVKDNAITLQSFNGGTNGTIEVLNNRRMRITFYMPNGYGGTYPLTIHFSRQ